MGAKNGIKTDCPAKRGGASADRRPAAASGRREVKREKEVTRNRGGSACTPLRMVPPGNWTRLSHNRMKQTANSSSDDGKGERYGTSRPRAFLLLGALLRCHPAGQPGSYGSPVSHDFSAYLEAGGHRPLAAGLLFQSVLPGRYLGPLVAGRKEEIASKIPSARQQRGFFDRFFTNSIQVLKR